MGYARNSTLTLMEILTALKTNKERLKELYSEQDKRINTLYHEIEITRYNAAEGFNKLRELQTTLRKRRLIKQELSQLDVLHSSLSIDNILNQVKKADNTLEKKYHNDTEYTGSWNMSIDDILQSV